MAKTDLFTTRQKPPHNKGPHPNVLTPRASPLSHGVLAFSPKPCLPAPKGAKSRAY